MLLHFWLDETVQILYFNKQRDKKELIKHLNTRPRKVIKKNSEDGLSNSNGILETWRLIGKSNA